jgi:hypothetical protein
VHGRFPCATSKMRSPERLHAVFADAARGTNGSAGGAVGPCSFGRPFGENRPRIIGSRRRNSGAFVPLQSLGREASSFAGRSASQKRPCCRLASTFSNKSVTAHVRVRSSAVDGRTNVPAAMWRFSQTYIQVPSGDCRSRQLHATRTAPHDDHSKSDAIVAFAGSPLHDCRCRRSP